MGIRGFVNIRLGKKRTVVCSGGVQQSDKRAEKVKRGNKESLEKRKKEIRDHVIGDLGLYIHCYYL